MAARYFYPRSPCGERRINRVKRLLPSWISIHALLAESDPLTHVRSPSANISIHALLAESDRRVQQVRQVRLGISIHALLAESDILGNVVAGLHMSFLSTLSLRRATSLRSCMPTAPRYFYPRSPCGERLELFAERFGDTLISIHALLAESDLGAGSVSGISSNFYPRSPCGERRFPGALRATKYKFLSTLSLRRATFIRIDKTQSAPNFYPRSPCGERHGQQFWRR